MKWFNFCYNSGSNTKKITKAVVSELFKRYYRDDNNLPIVNNDILNNRNNGYVPNEIEQATPYTNALSKLWCLDELFVISVQNMNYNTDEEVSCRLDKLLNN